MFMSNVYAGYVIKEIKISLIYLHAKSLIFFDELIFCFSVDLWIPVNRVSKWVYNRALGIIVSLCKSYSVLYMYSIT
jgi:hypothetical protein